MAKAKTSNDLATLRRLNQQSAAWLVGVSARTLRDWVDAPRNDDGSYDGRELVAWAQKRLPRPDITDQDYERLLVIIDELATSGAGCCSGAAMLDILTELRDVYGENAWLMFVDLLIEKWSEDFGGDKPASYIEPDETEIRQRVLESIDNKRIQTAHNRLEIAVVCPECGRLRRGRKWVEDSPPSRYAVVGQQCNDCADAELAILRGSGG